MGSAISWLLKEVWQVIEFVERNHTLGDGVSFLSINCSFHGVLMLIQLVETKKVKIKMSKPMSEVLHASLKE